MDPASPTLISPEIPARLWIDQPEVAIYIAEQSARQMHSDLDNMTLAVGGVGVALIGALMTKRGRGILLGMIPGPWGAVLRGLNEMTPDERRQQAQQVRPEPRTHRERYVKDATGADLPDTWDPIGTTR